MKSPITITEWVDSIINGVGGMNDFVKHEMVILNEPERNAAARWTITCLANPRCEVSEDVINAILARRKYAAEALEKEGVK